jgi:hypothetical protein
MKVVHEVLEVRMGCLLEREVEGYLWKQRGCHLKEFLAEEEVEMLENLLIRMGFEWSVGKERVAVVPLVCCDSIGS